MSDEIQIDDGVEIPKIARSGGGARGSKYDFMADMEVGQSFFTTKTSAQSKVSDLNRDTDMTFKTRRVTENDVAGFRIWRTA